MHWGSIDGFRPPSELIAANFLFELEKLSIDLLVKFGSCRSVKQQLPANEQGFVQAGHCWLSSPELKPNKEIKVQDNN